MLYVEQAGLGIALGRWVHETDVDELRTEMKRDMKQEARMKRQWDSGGVHRSGDGTLVGELGHPVCADVKSGGKGTHKVRWRRSVALHLHPPRRMTSASTENVNAETTTRSGLTSFMSSTIWAVISAFVSE